MISQGIGHQSLKEKVNERRCRADKSKDLLTSRTFIYYINVLVIISYIIVLVLAGVFLYPNVAVQTLVSFTFCIYFSLSSFIFMNLLRNFISAIVIFIFYNLESVFCTNVINHFVRTISFSYLILPTMWYCLSGIVRFQLF